MTALQYLALEMHHRRVVIWQVVIGDEFGGQRSELRLLRVNHVGVGHAHVVGVVRPLVLMPEADRVAHFVKDRPHLINREAGRFVLCTVFVLVHAKVENLAIAIGYRCTRVCSCVRVCVRMHTRV